MYLIWSINLFLFKHISITEVIFWYFDRAPLFRFLFKIKNVLGIVVHCFVNNFVVNCCYLLSIFIIVTEFWHYVIMFVLLIEIPVFNVIKLYWNKSVPNRFITNGFLFPLLMYWSRTRTFEDYSCLTKLLVFYVFGAKVLN